MPQNTCFSYSICTYHTASCFASLYKITNTVFFVVEDDPKGDPPCRYKSHHHSSLLQSASNTINPKKSNMHLLKELMEIGYLSEFLDYTLPVSVAVGFPLSASFPVESKRHSSEN
ncbi:LOW QUALITY PROTEIN: hypothetical protein NC651_000648 [Populus alba x Populus x berolinensis]|nr:LOW QUALITY PROTEIN: hypothetical protein NC651_000648 [Populus alba x Populus x berolinensis]